MEVENIKGKKILYVFEYFPPYQHGGAEISGKIRMERLSKANDIVMLMPNYDRFEFGETKKKYTMVKFPSVRCFLYKIRKQTSHKMIKKSRGLFHTSLLFFNILSSIEMGVWIRKINKRYGPFDIIHGNNSESDIGVAFSKVPAKKIAHLRDTIIFEKIRFGNFLQGMIKNRLNKNIDHFITISRFMKNKCVKLIGINPKKISIVYNDISKEQISNTSKEKARKKLGFRKGKKYVLFVGSLTKEKGIDFLIKGVASRIKELEFIIVGKGILEEKLKKSLPSNVEMVGFVKNDCIKYYYKAADVVVVPSVWEEPWGRVSREAQANGTFTIVNDKGGLPETIIKGKGAVVKNSRLADYLKRYLKP